MFGERPEGPAVTDDVLRRKLPRRLVPLRDLALDLRWTWSHGADFLWRRLDPEAWERLENPWALLQDVSNDRLRKAARDSEFIDALERLEQERRGRLAEPGWYAPHAAEGPERVAYFCMEFGLGEALPLYAGGLGILAGDYLKTASDLGVPVVGVGLLYQQGYFRQVIEADGRQSEAFPYNDPIGLPIEPVASSGGGWLHVAVELPGRSVMLRVWKATAGRVALYLLDSNDPLNSAADRGITAELYPGNPTQRLQQEILLGIGGWRALEALEIPVELCHLNEGHAAFAVLERARSFMAEAGVSFPEALAATRAGNVFTTHTAVHAAFDVYAPALIERYLPYFHDPSSRLGIADEELLALGRARPEDSSEPFNMAYLAIRGSLVTNAVSRLHGQVSRRLFAGVYPRWPEEEVPIRHVTNGVHVPSWDSRWADRVWEEAAGKKRWLGELEAVGEAIRRVSDAELWAFRAESRKQLVAYARRRLQWQLAQRGAGPEAGARAERVLDPNALTMGFARRFTEYKRPNLLLRDRGRLIRLLTDGERPLQIVVAGKAHPEDGEGKAMIKEWIDLAADPLLRDRVVFLEDYDITLAQEMVRGVDLWINTPRRPWEACGTSGMKVLVNGGLNLSERDGWWSEAFTAQVGWAIGDGREHAEPGWDDVEAGEVYRLLERQIVPAFYDRDDVGLPRAWISRIRASMGALAPQFSSNRMLREYVESVYLPLTASLRRRSAGGAVLARELAAWQSRLAASGHGIHFGNATPRPSDGGWEFAVEVYLGDVDADSVRVEVYAEPLDSSGPVRLALTREEAIPGAVHGWIYRGRLSTDRPAGHFTARVVPDHPEARVPAESSFILWQR
jgi:starch phosphorylase